MALSLLEQRRSNVDEAQKLLVNFLREVDSNHVGALKQLARLHQREGHWSQAAGCFHRLIAVDPTNTEWTAQLQACMEQLPIRDEHGQMMANQRAFSFAEPMIRDQAMSVLQSRNGGYAGGQVGGHLSNTSTTCSSFAAGPGCGPQMRHQQPGNAVAIQLSEARRQRDNGRPDAALGIFRGVLRIDAHNSEALFGFADCQEDLGNMDAALEAVKQLLSIKPDDPEANLKVAELLLHAGYDVQMAEPYLKRANHGQMTRTGASVNGSPPWKNRLCCAEAEAFLAKEEYTQALASASEAVRLDASSPKALLLLGHGRVRVADYQAGLRAFTACLDACSGKQPTQNIRCIRITAHALSAQAHERLREFSEASAKVKNALDEASGIDLAGQLAQTVYEARVTRAMAMQQSGRTGEAEAELMAILQLQPQQSMARLQLGYCQLCANNSSRAAAILEALLAGQTSIPRSQLGAAKVYLALALDMQQDRNQRAGILAKEGLSLHRNLQTVWREIETGKHNSQPMAAVQRLRGICDLDLSSSQAKQLLKLLAGATGRLDLIPAGNLGGGGGSGYGTPVGGPPGSGFLGGAQSRSGSTGPPRWAPNGGGPSHSGMSTPQNGSFLMGSGPMPLGSGQRMRGSFMSDSDMSSQPGSFYCAGGQQPRGRQMPGSAGSREASKERESKSLTIGWNELIRPEQLTFGPQLGSGGSATVFRGSWNGQEVAIKKISGVAHLDEMKKEIDALRRLRHPRLVRFIGACVQPPMLLVVTEFMAGGSLHDRIFGKRNIGPMPMLQRWSIASQIAEGLAFLHSQRVVHRDLKSMNVLLDVQGSAKICDFGLAHQMCVESTHIARKLDGEGGSPRYMAPECYDAGLGKLTEKVDVWAMGCIFIELFGNVLPYADCVTMPQLTARILVQKRPPDVPPTVPPPLVEICCRCLQFDPARRITGAELQALLLSAKGRIPM
eukprot:TRINITY_DN35315_c0_g1_i1.p1 TRINITY_DN35315_c0_g1~~TRINITY_DN35315_c0_g1_i1.p1  ORF type:complete len:1075 (-),score=210.90 TRINITY_DN35315_c0_g1_i1:93-2954(-)